MALQILDPGMIGAAANWYAANVLTTPNSLTYSWDGNTANVNDRAAATPTFDTDHVVYTSPIVDNASQNSIGDNSNGLEDPLTVDPTLTYTYTSGFRVDQSSSQAVTVGVEQSFDYAFAGIGGGTTLSASGTFTWGQGTSQDETRSVSEALRAPFEVPKGKIYEEKLLFTQETAQVPYTTQVLVDGTVHFTAPGNDIDYPIAAIFWFIHGDIYGFPPDIPEFNFGVPPPYKDVNWGDVGATDPDPPLDQRPPTQGYFQQHGTLTMHDAGTARVKIYDITDQNKVTEVLEKPVAIDDLAVTFQPVPAASTPSDVA
jgi:hypothetical protein